MAEWGGGGRLDITHLQYGVVCSVCLLETAVAIDWCDFDKR